MESVVLVDEMDNELGTMEKYEAHRHPVKLHRAFSVFIFDKDGRMLIARRSLAKKTWPGFWSNACCSHPRPEEPVDEAAKRRLAEELGFVTNLKYAFTFQYNAKYDDTWGENEVDHVFVGICDGNIKINTDEVAEVMFMEVKELEEDVKVRPWRYTPWFRMSLPRVLEYKRSANI